MLVGSLSNFGKEPLLQIVCDSTPNPTKLARISLEGAPKPASGIAHRCPLIVSQRTVSYVWRRMLRKLARVMRGFFTPSRDARILSLGSE